MTPDPADELRFDRAELDTTSAPADRPTIPCASCGAAITSEYYHVNGRSMCEPCRLGAEAAGTPARGTAVWVRAALFGLGAAVAGAIVYYAVIAIANLEIGIVAILIGYMVGWAVRKATGGRGSRGFQILAAALTYWAVGLAYTPVAFREMARSKSDSTAVSARADSLRTSPSADTTAKAAKSAKASEKGVALLPALAFLFGFTFVLPLLAIFGSMPSGLLSGLIIFFGLQQAWRMTGRPPLVVSGPYRVGGAPPA